MHRTLIRQLRKLGLQQDKAPDTQAWQALLEVLSTSYREADEGRYLIERSLQISSREMAELYARRSERLEDRLQAILGALPDLLFLIDDQGRYLEVLTGDEALLVAPVEQMRGARLQEFIPKDTAEQLLGVIRAAIQSGELQIVKYEHASCRGELHTFEGRVQPSGYKVGGRHTVVFLAHDITLQESSARNARLLEVVISAAREGVVIVGRDRRVLYANPSALEITGFTELELLEGDRGFLRHEQDRALCDAICTQANQGSHWQDEIEIHTKMGEKRLVWLNLDTLRNEAGELEYFVAIINDITDIHRSRAELEHVATHDILTGLPNRALFEERLEQALSRARRQKGHGALLLLDLDRFKQINDSLGHTVGDGLLVEVAQRLMRASRVEDLVSRLGGDEFTLVLEDLEDIEQAAVVARKILNVFKEPMMIESLTLDVSTSIGIATFPAEGESIGDLLKQADAAMYKAKEAGGNQFRFHTPELSECAMSNISLQSALRAAVSAGALRVFYQPQFDLASGDLRGLEALLRWPRPDGSLMLPEEFIGVAEVSGLIEPLGLWVLREVCAQAAAWQEQDLDYLSIAVNVSGRQLVNPGFAGQVAELLERFDLPGHRLEIEITESMVIHEGDMRHRNLYELHALGIRLAIDDFGTGHSSLVNLKRFPLHRLKIDRSFIHDMGKDPNDEAIVGATIALAKELGMEVVAEGVETSFQQQFLRELGCDLVQGYLYADPMSAEQVTRCFSGLEAGRPCG